MQIKIEDLSAKQIINFFPPQPLAPISSAILFDVQNQVDNEFIKNILSIDGVQYCLITDILIAIKYTDSNNVDDIKSLILAEIDDFINEKRELISLVSPIKSLRLIEAIADSFIRPTLNRDNGDIKIHDFSNGILNIQFTGHCAGCPYAQNTLNNVIAKTLLKYIPEIKSISLKE